MELEKFFRFFSSYIIYLPSESSGSKFKLNSLRKFPKVNMQICSNYGHVLHTNALLPSRTIAVIRYFYVLNIYYHVDKLNILQGIIDSFTIFFLIFSL